MKTTMVRYKIRVDRVAENESHIKQMFEELQATQPKGLHYTSFKLEDGQEGSHA